MTDTTGEHGGTAPGPDTRGDAADRSPDQPVGTLRGAGVGIDAATAGRIGIVVLLVALVVVGMFLLFAGVRKNAQVDELRSGGVPVQVTISHCLGLMGGTGSSPAGYECVGGYTFRGVHYVEGVPGSTYYPDLAVVAGVVPPGDPGLLSTPATVASLRPSDTLYVVGAALLLLAAGIAVWLVFRRRRAGA